MSRDRKPEREPEDLAQAYDRLAPALYRFARMVLGVRDEAEDVVQQVFMTLVRTGTLPTAADTYLFSAVRNECISVLRRRRRLPPEAGHEWLEVIPGTESSADERIALEQALARLPPDQREVLHLKVYEGLTFQAIAVVLGESIGTVTSRYRYALDKMKSYLNRE